MNGGNYYSYAGFEGPEEERLSPYRPLCHPYSSRDKHESPQVTYKPDYFIAHAFEQLASMRDRDELCDVAIRVGETTLRAHKTVLAACSPYFHAMFSGELRESRDGEVTIKDCNAAAVRSLVDFCYQPSLTIDLTNVLDLLPAACFFQMVGVQEACCTFLASQLHPSNCLGIRMFADVHSCQSLWKKCNIFLQQRFPEVALNEEFLELSFSELKKIVSDSHLNVRGEEQIYESIMAWAKHNKEERKNSVKELLKLVRMPLMSAAYLSREVKNESLIMDDFDCRGQLIEAMDYHLQKHYLRDSHSAKKSLSTTPRQCPGLEYLFAIGGSGPPMLEDPYLDICECYDADKNEWRQVASLPTRRSGLRITTCGGYLYAVGGFSASDTKALAVVDRYDPMTDSWRSMAQMKYPRRGFALAVLNGYIYAIGGINGGTYYDSVERYCPKMNKWKLVQPMTVERRAVCAIAMDNYIYAAGGHDGEGLLDSIERYDPVSDLWVVVATLTSPRCLGALIAIKGYLYAVGGYDGINAIQLLQRYNQETKDWTTVTKLPIQRSGFGSSVMDGRLYLVGGCDSLTKVNSVDCYDPDKDQWLSVAKMSLRRSGLGAGVTAAFLY